MSTTTPKAVQSERLFSTSSVAKHVDRSSQYVRNDIRAGLLDAKKKGVGTNGTYLVKQSELDRYTEWLAAGRPEDES